jgi:hypothetical protein
MLTVIKKMLEEYKRKLAIRYIRSLFIKYGYPNIDIVSDGQIEDGIACMATLVNSSKFAFSEVLVNILRIHTAIDLDIREAASDRVAALVSGAANLSEFAKRTSLFDKRNKKS